MEKNLTETKISILRMLESINEKITFILKEKLQKQINTKKYGKYSEYWG